LFARAAFIGRDVSNVPAALLGAVGPTLRARFSPARAGNTVCPSTSEQQGPLQPRTRGEHPVPVWVFEPTNKFGGYVRTSPKGTVVSGLSLAANAAKEVFEETGLLIEVGQPLIDTERTASVCRYFLGQRIGGDPSNMGWEAQAVCLTPVDGAAA
jgi:hypothetical protein